MEAVSTIPRQAPLDLAKRIDWGAISTWLLGFGLIVYLGLKGGGYDPLVHNQVGIAIWWILLAGVLVGALPQRRLSVLGWSALALLAAFVVWTALSLTWTESAERTSADLAQVGAYLGVFALALFAYNRRSGRRMVAAVGTGIAVVAMIALLSRLHPSWFPEAGQTTKFLPHTKERLSYPLNYWNGLAALAAIGLPLLLQVATCAKTVLFRALAAATLPALALACFLTFSRGGAAAAVLALIVFFALTSDRLPKLLTLLVASAGGAILIGAVTQRGALQHGLLNAAARHQGNEMLSMTLVVCAGVGLIQAGIATALIHSMRPRWTLVSRRQSLAVVLASAIAVVIVAAAFNAPGRISHAWRDFKHERTTRTGTQHLTSVAGEGRYQFWSAAVHEEESKPLTGTGSGTFEFWWDRNGSIRASVIDAHSLYIQTFGELGIVGLALLAAFLAVIFIGGIRATLRSSRQGRPQLAASVAGCAAFCLTASFDWVWQIPVIPVAMLLLASALVSAEARSKRSSGLRLPLRTVFAAAAVAAIVAIAIPLASETAVRQSQADARAGNLRAALTAARTAQNAQPSAATPRLQQALLFEAKGDLEPAATAAHAATERESTNWRTWLVLSRIEAEKGRANAALHAYKKARSLNPHSPIFAQ